VVVPQVMHATQVDEWIELAATEQQETSNHPSHPVTQRNGRYYTVAGTLLLADILSRAQDPAVVRAILAHLGLAPGPESPGPAPPQPDHTAATG
jgi:hypothetical protein